jgi:hypothetical protein
LRRGLSQPSPEAGCAGRALRACPTDVADIARHAGQPVIVGRHEGRSSKAARGAMVAVLPGG